MDILILYVLGFGVATGTSLMAMRRYSAAYRWEGRRAAVPEAKKWRDRAICTGVLTGLAALAKFLAVFGVIQAGTAAAYYTFPLLTLGLWFAATRLIVSLCGEKPGWGTLIGSIVIGSIASIASLLVTIVSGFAYGIPLLLHIVVGLAGLFVGFRPAIQRWRFNRALVRARAQRGDSHGS